MRKQIAIEKYNYFRWVYKIAILFLLLFSLLRGYILFQEMYKYGITNIIKIKWYGSDIY